MSFCFFFFNDTATTEIYTLSLHDALPISHPNVEACSTETRAVTDDGSTRSRYSCGWSSNNSHDGMLTSRSEEHTSELQSHLNLVCRLLLEKKKKDASYQTH